jgi:hypothetical protein
MKSTVVAICVLLISAWPAHAEDVTNIATNQGVGTAKSCDTTGNLSSGTFSQVSSDNAGQPCVEKSSGQGDSDDTCDSDSEWNYTVHGHVTFGPPSSGTRATTLEVQTYIGGNGILCTGGSTVTCSGTYTLAEDSTYTVGAHNESVPFDATESLLAPYRSVQGDGNYQAFYVFAKPIGGKVQCTANNYATEEHN